MASSVNRLFMSRRLYIVYYTLNRRYRVRQRQRIHDARETRINHVYGIRVFDNIDVVGDFHVFPGFAQFVFGRFGLFIHIDIVCTYDNGVWLALVFADYSVETNTSIRGDSMHEHDTIVFDFVVGFQRRFCARYVEIVDIN